MCGYDGHRTTRCCCALVGLAIVSRGRLTLTSCAACDRRLCTTAVATGHSITTPDFAQAFFAVDTNFFPQCAVMPMRWGFPCCDGRVAVCHDGAQGAEIDGVTEGVWAPVNCRSRRMPVFVRAQLSNGDAGERAEADHRCPNGENHRRGRCGDLCTQRGAERAEPGGVTRKPPRAGQPPAGRNPLDTRAPAR